VDDANFKVQSNMPVGNGNGQHLTHWLESADWAEPSEKPSGLTNLTRPMTSSGMSGAHSIL
jgi:murein endopeptidase